MRLSLRLTIVPLALVTLSTLVSANRKPHFGRRSPLGVPTAHLNARDATGNFNQLFLASNYQNGSTAPGASSNDAPGQQVVVGGTGADDDSQRPGCDTIFINTAQVQGSADTGWTEIPEVTGFYVDRNITYGSATMPVYIESGKDLTKIKRVIIGQPGKPRDAWKYSSLFRNSLVCAVSNSSMAVTLDDVLITAPIWLNDEDHTAGSGEPTDVYFSSGGWNVGSKAIGPNNADPSSFEVLDDMIKRFADTTTFPAVTSVIVGGHSLGASIAQRYAMLRNKDSDTDDLVQFWIGNPGAYVWPSTQRPVTPTNTSCASQVDDWAYGVASGLPAYVKGKPTADELYSRYRDRTIQYALGLSDDGPGDTHCEAQYQGSSHLSRGQNMQKALEGMQGGMPASQTFNYVPNTSHQDYLMMSDPNSQQYLFVTGLADPRPASATKSSSSSSGKGSGSGSKSGGGSNASASSGTKSPAGVVRVPAKTVSLITAALVAAAAL